MVAPLVPLGAALALAALACTHTHRHHRHHRHAAGKIQVDPSSELARSLRRQLMEDNYDYTTTGSAEGAPLPQNTADGPRDTAAPHTPPHREGGNEGKEVEKTVTGTVNGTRRANSNDKSLYRNKDRARRRISRKLARRRKKFKKYKSVVGKDMAERYRARYRYKPGDGDASGADEPGGPATLVHYRVLQVSEGHRRSGQGGALIQEESPRGVALVRLGGGPFPELRLPTDDPTPLADHNTHERDNSLKITVTPNDILVL